jgi:hypothetical protein
MGTVEPVFGNLQNKGMRRFTLRGRNKVDAQWQLFTVDACIPVRTPCGGPA